MQEMMSKCNICNGDLIDFYRSIKKCEDCGHGQSELKKTPDYTNESNFDIEKNNKHFMKFAERDYSLIEDQFSGLPSKNWKILEIGAGLGFLSKLIMTKNENVDIEAFEMNPTLIEHMKSRGISVTDDYDKGYYDVIIMDHVLEHISDASKFIDNLSSKADKIILFQTNHEGVIPKFLPFLWYGWSLKEHYHHFTESSIREVAINVNATDVEFRYYKLDQVLNFSLKSIAKIPLILINRLLKPGKSNDAFVAIISTK